MPKIIIKIKLAFLLTLLAVPAAANPLVPQDATEATLLSVESVDRLLVNLDGQAVPIRVAGIAAHPNCARDSNHWAQAMLSPHPTLYVSRARYGPDAAGRLQRRIAFLYRGQWVDYGMTALQEGHAVTRDAPPGEIDAEVYAGVEDEARAEQRGLWGACHSPLEAFREAARHAGFTPETLYGIAMNESSYKGRPWPWTLNVAGKSYYYPDRVSAWRAAEQLRSRRVNAFDIGLMQVNWKWHGHRFRSTWDALQPEINRRVAAAILAENLKAHGSLKAAVGSYHSANPGKAEQYWQRFQAQLRRFRSVFLHE